MRMPRLRIDSEGCYYHLISRAVGTSGDRPFGDREKGKLVALLGELSEFYTIEPLAYSMMSNHVHVVAFAPSEQPDVEVAVARYNAYQKMLAERREKATGLKVPAKSVHPGSENLEHVRGRMRDISYFMKDLQQRFTQWYNKGRERRGTIWADRFKSVLLEGEAGNSAVWNCIKYIELNAVRAGIVEDPGDYRFCSWGVWCGRGKHPYAKSFLAHSRRVLGDRGAKLSDKQLQCALRAELVRTLAAERGASEEEILAAYREAQRPEPLLLRVDRRVRYWSDRAVIGSKEFVERVNDQLLDAGKKKRRFAEGQLSGGDSLFMLRRLRE